MGEIMKNKNQQKIQKVADTLNSYIFDIINENYTNNQEIINDLNKVLKRLYKLAE